MNHLLRELAPISDAGWAEIEKEVTDTLRPQLAGRRLFELEGPHGWEHAAVVSGRTEVPAAGPVDGTEAAIRQTWPLVEVRSRFTVSRQLLAEIDRGRPDPDLRGAAEAARQAGMAEDTAIFRGYAPAGMTGIAGASEHEPIVIPDDYNRYPTVVARAVHAMVKAGIDGPYGIALGPQCYTGVIETTEHGGYPVFEHLRLILGGPVVRAPAVDGAAVVSLRGGDFRFVGGQDLSIGYDHHDADAVHLYIEESFRFDVLEPAATLSLVYEDKSARRLRKRA